MYRTLAALFAATLATSAWSDSAGLRIESLDLSHHDASARMAIWYPSTGQADATLYGDNPVFEGVEAHMDDTVAEGVFPVVLFSHGMGGTDRAQAWLGQSLAERGAIVVMVNHPNSTWGSFDMSKGVEHWTRAADMTAAMDALQQKPDFAGQIDTSRIMAAGFSFGGWTALSLGGVTGNHAGIVEACETYGETMEACGMLLSDRVAMQDLDAKTWNASCADPRVTHVAAIDPGFVWGLEAGDVQGLFAQTMIIGFGGEGDRMLATDFDRSGLSTLLPEAEIVRFDPAYHFTAMPLCKPAAEAILEADQDDPVCTDPKGSDRAAIHDQIVERLANALNL